MSAISDRAKKQVERVRMWPGFKSAHSVLELGAGSFETLAELARSYPDKQFYGVDFVLRPPAMAIAADAPEHLHILQHDVRDLSLFPDGHIDFVYSVALVEHVRELDAHLREVYRVLREGGRYCFSESPLWSSSLGHHYKHSSPDCPIPHFGHLYMTREQLGEFLVSESGKTLEESAQILRQVYDRKDLSRLSRSQTRKIVGESSFVIESWRENRDKNCDEKAVETVMRNNLYGLSADDLEVSSIVCTLRKGGDDDLRWAWKKWIRRVLRLSNR